MKTWKYAVKYAAPVAMTLLLAGPLAAQNDNEFVVADDAARDADVDRRMMDAERRMAEAARDMAALSSERLPQVARFERHIEISDRPRLGVAIGTNDEEGPVEGVSIVAVTPGTAASDAGLRAGDVITAINSESLSASSSSNANQKLLDFMSGVEEGDALDVEYLRNGKVGKVEVMPKTGAPNVFVWEGAGGPDFDVRVMPGIPGMPGVAGVGREPGAPRIAGGPNFSWVFAANGLGDMELVELNEGLGRYFGTDEGLLVVSAPKSNDLQLQDGDVIQSIDGRKPTSVRHGLQILGTYQAGEKLDLQIMRDKKRKTLAIEMPDGRSGMLFDNFAAPVLPAAVPAPARAPTPVIVIERT